MKIYNTLINTANALVVASLNSDNPEITPFQKVVATTATVTYGVGTGLVMDHLMKDAGFFTRFFAAMAINRSIPYVYNLSVNISEPFTSSEIEQGFMDLTY